MKKSLLLVCALVLLINSTVFAQSKSVSLHINHLLNGSLYSTILPSKAPGDYYFKPSLLRYYVSKIKITHDGGKMDEATGLYLLVNAAANNEYILGNFDITTVEGIEFGIGIESGVNHLNPTNYPDGNPLALQEPSMHWGWASGYRFITFEGLAGASNASLNASFQVHSLGDNLYRTVKLPVKGSLESGNIIIYVDAEYSNLLIGINVKAGLISHDSQGESEVLMNNISTSVFSAPKSSGVQESDVSPLGIFPNPAGKTITITSALQHSSVQTLTITNSLGQEVFSMDYAEQHITLPHNLITGNYTVSILQNGRTIGRKKLVVIE